METQHLKITAPAGNDEAIALIQQKFADGWKLDSIWFIRPAQQQADENPVSGEVVP